MGLCALLAPLLAPAATSSVSASTRLVSQHLAAHGPCARSSHGCSVPPMSGGWTRGVASWPDPRAERAPRDRPGPFGGGRAPAQLKPASTLSIDVVLCGEGPALACAGIPRGRSSGGFSHELPRARVPQRGAVTLACDGPDSARARISGSELRDATVGGATLENTIEAQRVADDPPKGRQIDVSTLDVAPRAAKVDVLAPIPVAIVSVGATTLLGPSPSLVDPGHDAVLYRSDAQPRGAHVCGVARRSRVADECAA
jgi:hypothetical protein